MLPQQCLNGKKIATSVFKNIFSFLSIFFFSFSLVFHFYLFLLEIHSITRTHLTLFFLFFLQLISKNISIEECYSIVFYHPKKLLYQLYHTILQYTLHPKTLLFYFFIKIFFFNIFLLFLSHHHFFSAKG